MQILVLPCIAGPCIPVGRSRVGILEMPRVHKYSHAYNAGDVWLTVQYNPMEDLDF